METVRDFIFLGSRITVDDDCSHEIKRHLLLESKEERKWKWSHSVVSDSLRPHELSPSSLLHPWDFPSKNTGMGCHFLLQEIFLTQGLKPQLLNWQANFFFFFFFYHWATWEAQRTLYCLITSVKVRVNIVYWEKALDPSSVFIIISTTFSIAKNNPSCSFPEISRLSILAF